MSRLPMYEPSECSCQTCQSMCTRPCWPSPEEARKIIDAGLGHRLMLDKWERIFEDHIYLLCPALKNHEGSTMLPWPRSDEGCTFWDSNKLCEIHHSGFKPVEGRLASCSGHQNDLHFKTAQLWDNQEAQDLVEEWRNSYE